jgi:hypothetical protein
MSRNDKFFFTFTAVIFLSLLYTAIKLENGTYQECLRSHSCLKELEYRSEALAESDNVYYTEYEDGRWNRVTTRYVGNDILEVYVEDSSGYWSIHEHDSAGNLIRWVDSFGIWTPDSGLDTPESFDYTG